MAREITVKCDVDGSDDRITTWVLETPEGNLVDLDLCFKHAEPLRRLQAKGRVRPDGAAASTTARAMDRRVRGLGALDGNHQ